MNILNAAERIRGHQEGVLNWHIGRITDSLLESLFNRIYAAKDKTRSYRSNRNLIMIVYLVAGPLNFEFHPVKNEFRKNFYDNIFCFVQNPDGGTHDADATIRSGDKTFYSGTNSTTSSPAFICSIT
jgi:hypothetical protein